MSGRAGDVGAVLRGLLLLCEETTRVAAQRTARQWRTSSVNPGRAFPQSMMDEKQQAQQQPDSTSGDQSPAAQLTQVLPATVMRTSVLTPSELAGRLSMVTQGITAYLGRHNAVYTQQQQQPVPPAAQSMPPVQGATANSTSQAARPYDPIMDPSITELNLESLLAADKEVESTGEHASQDSSKDYDNLIFHNNKKLLEDLNVGADFLESRLAARLAQEATVAVDETRFNLETSLDNAKDRLDDLKEDTQLRAAQVLDTAELAQISDSIEVQLQKLRGTAFIDDLDLDSIQQQSSSMAHQAQTSTTTIDKSIEAFASAADSAVAGAVAGAAAGAAAGAVLAAGAVANVAGITANVAGPAAAAASSVQKQVGTFTEMETKKAFEPEAMAPSFRTAQPVSKKETPAVRPPKLLGRKPLAKDKPESLLSSSSKARRVPDSRLGRIVSFSGLAAGLGMGALAEVTRRSLGINSDGDKFGGDALLGSSPFLTEANANRIVDTLCKVRGAALKIGQMLSLQDNTFINPQLQQIFERVRQSADFMPNWQLRRIMSDELGSDWREQFTSFDEKPFAAASIGEVHEGILPDGRRVAVKVQYPGVADGIESDINNLLATLNVAKIIPEGFFVDSVVRVAKRELAWECDYERELQCGKRFAELVAPYPQFYVPDAIPHLSTKRIITTELIEGVSIDKCVHLDQETRNLICNHLLELTLRELFQFGYMQTDPNWANFFYNDSTQQIALVDFGACREFDKSFVDVYIEIIHGAATRDREKVRRYSQEIGFLTGHEAKVMVDAHVESVMILGETFQDDVPFSFSDQNATSRVQKLMPVMLQHRMCPPPDEIYSLHRKMSGVFLLCARLGGVVNVNPLFFDIYRNYRFGGDWSNWQSTTMAM